MTVEIARPESREELRARLIDLIVECCDGGVTAADVASGAALTDLGVTSLATLRLVDAVETTYAVELDMVGLVTATSTVDTFADDLWGSLGH
jgi:acyl carrier protein